LHGESASFLSADRNKRSVTKLIKSCKRFSVSTKPSERLRAIDVI
jgi:hypothetical protein